MRIIKQGSLHSFFSLSRLLLIFVISLYITPAWAEKAGTVTYIEGKATLSDGTVLSKGSAIDSSDTITTGEDSKLTLEMIDDAEIELGAKGKLKLSEYRFQQGGAANSVLMDVVRGFFRTISGKIGKNKTDIYQLRAYFIAIGIQGTEYQVLIKEGEAFIEAKHGIITIDKRCAMNADISQKRQGDGKQEGLKEVFALQPRCTKNTAQSERFGDKQAYRFVHLKEAVVITRGGSSNGVTRIIWDRSKTKPSDFPTEFQ